VFYKVWNGRKKPKMPAQKDELTKEQIWQIVSYVQTLRTPAQ
jgi:mono/diheme cytochrome c family protein